MKEKFLFFFNFFFINQCERRSEWLSEWDWEGLESKVEIFDF